MIRARGRGSRVSITASRSRRRLTRLSPANFGSITSRPIISWPSLHQRQSANAALITISVRTTSSKNSGAGVLPASVFNSRSCCSRKETRAASCSSSGPRFLAATEGAAPAGLFRGAFAGLVATEEGFFRSGSREVVIPVCLSPMRSTYQRPRESPLLLQDRTHWRDNECRLSRQTHDERRFSHFLAR
jgi:hypothetical protein